MVEDSQKANYMHAFQNLSAHINSATSDTLLNLLATILFLGFLVLGLVLRFDLYMVLRVLVCVFV